MFRWGLKIIFGIGFILCCIVVILMYSKLSFIDWLYVIGGGISLTIGILLPTEKNRKI